MGVHSGNQWTNEQTRQFLKLDFDNNDGDGDVSACVTGKRRIRKPLGRERERVRPWTVGYYPGSFKLFFSSLYH